MPASGVSSASAAPVQQIWATGTTLFAIAEQYLGDATQWDRIASLNGISDPWLTGVPQSILIPPVSTAASGQVVTPSGG